MNLPQEFSRLIIPVHQIFQSLTGGFKLLFSFIGRFKLYILLRLIIKRFGINHVVLVPFLTFHFFIKPVTLLISMSALLHHFLESVGHFKELPPFIIRYSGIEIFGHMIQHVKSGHICGTECCRFGIAGQCTR